MQNPVEYSELRAALQRAGFVEEAAGYHGTLCGALCVQPPEQVNVLNLLDNGETPLRADAEAAAAFRRLREQALVALQDDQLGFSLLLPDDAEALEPRVTALAAWCEGFLFGLASKPGLDINQCSEDAREILRDLTQFTRASLGEGEDLELEENAYAELVEYVRVGAQLIFMELRPRPVPDPTDSRKLH